MHFCAQLFKWVLVIYAGSNPFGGLHSVQGAGESRNTTNYLWFIETGEKCWLDGLIGAYADLTMFKAHIFVP